MSQFAIGGSLGALAALTWWLAQSETRRPTTHWTRGWLFFFASSVIYVMAEGTAWGECAMHLLSPYFPALILAGALAFAGRRVPTALWPATFAVGGAGCALMVHDQPGAYHALGLVTEAGALVGAAVLTGRAALEAPRGARIHLLAPTFYLLAALEGTSEIMGLAGIDPGNGLVLAWSVVVPLAVLVQIGVGRERALVKRRGMERALSESQERFRALTENSSDLIGEIDQDNHFIYANPRHRDWFGSNQTDFAGTDAMELVHPDDRERMRAWYREQLNGATGTPLTIRVPHKDLGWRWVECNGRAFEADGKPRIVVALRDVTERIELEARLRRAQKRLEERVEERTAQLHAAVASLEEEVAERRRVEHELRLSEQRWREVSDLSSDLAFSITRSPAGDFETDWVTQAVTRISGRSRDEIDASGWSSVIHPDDLESVLANLRRISDGETVEFDGRVVTPVGRVRWMRTRITGAGTRPNGSLQILGAARDVTEARKAVEERLHLEAHIQEAQKLESLGVLAGGVAHDFNNVLAVILGNDALALSEAPPGSRLAKQLERIRSAAQHGQALTNQMLTYSGKVSVSLKPLDLYQLVEDMGELLGAAVSPKCELDISHRGSQEMVEGDPTQLQQVVMNLVTNASEALQDEPGRVAVRCGVMTADAAYLKDTFGTQGLSPGSYVYVEVSDPGPGIPEDVRNRIFEPFFSTKFTGRGLGLASVLGIVRGHGGAIKLVTAPNTGSRFRVLLPPASSPARTATKRPAPRREEREGSIHVLVVDDDEPVLEIAGEFLKRSGFDVTTAESGQRALEVLNGGLGAEIDVVVLDLSMPGLDGSETLREIRMVRPELPVVVASGYGESVTAERFPSSEIASFVRKPYEADDLAAAVRSALDD